MSNVPLSVHTRAARVTLDSAQYSACMLVIKARIFTIQKIINNEALIPYQMLKVETIYLQFRMLIEMLYLSAIPTRRKRFSTTWPKSEKEYQPSEIRKYLGRELDEYFPYRFKPEKRQGNTLIDAFDRPITESETFQFFNKCHQYLHEPNPYKKNWVTREAECPALIEEAKAKLFAFWQLLGFHYRVTELDDGERIGMVCNMGPHEQSPISIDYLISEAPVPSAKRSG